MNGATRGPIGVSASARVGGRRGLLIGAGLLLLSGCALAPAPGGTIGEAELGAGDRMSEATRPSSGGTMRQDMVSVPLHAGSLQIQVTPLADEVIRWTAPDTHRHLSALAESHRERAESLAGRSNGVLFLVAIRGWEPDVMYRAEELDIIQSGRIHRPLAVVPISTNWGAHNLRAHETATAIFVFSDDLDLSLPFEVRFGPASSDAWARVLVRLEQERARRGT